MLHEARHSYAASQEYRKRQLPGLQNSIVSGWPDLLHYRGPLPKSCGCGPPHPSRIGVTNNAVFHTQVTEPLGELFWKFCFASSRSPLVSNPITDGDIATRSDSQLFSLSSLSGSWSEVYKQWQLRKLTRHFLRDYTDSPNLDTYISGSSMGHAGSSGYSTASPTATPLQSSGVEGCREWQWRIDTSRLCSRGIFQVKPNAVARYAGTGFVYVGFLLNCIRQALL